MKDNFNYLKDSKKKWLSTETGKNLTVGRFRRISGFGYNIFEIPVRNPNENISKA